MTPTEQLISNMFTWLFDGSETKEPPQAPGLSLFRGRDPLARTRWVTVKAKEGKPIFTLREQNPHSASRFAELSRGGYRVAWFFIDGRYAEDTNCAIQAPGKEIWIGRGSDWAPGPT